MKILRLVIPYLELSETTNLLTLNRFIFEHLSHDVVLFWKLIFHRLAFYSNQEVNYDNIQQIFQNLFKIDLQDPYQALRILKSPNLVRNPYGAEQFAHWDVANRGNGWTIENWGTYKNLPCAFVSSYDWCKLQQQINVSDFRGMRFLAGIVICARWDCGGEA